MRLERLGEAIKGTYQSVFEKGKVHKISKKPESAPAGKYPEFRSEDVYKDMTLNELVWGISSKDLGFAVKHKRVKTGDRLEFRTEHFNTNSGEYKTETSELVYLRSEKLQALGDIQMHYFCDPEFIESYLKDEIAMSPSSITHWTKTGRVENAELEIIRQRIRPV